MPGGLAVWLWGMPTFSVHHVMLLHVTFVEGPASQSQAGKNALCLDFILGEQDHPFLEVVQISVCERLMLP